MRVADRRSRFSQADAVRLLLILYEVGEDIDSPATPALKKVIRSQIALLARDFWVRYPDYLADELIDLAVDTRDLELLDLADSLLADPEIEFDWLPMVRWKNGAYWWMTDAIAILVSNELVEYHPRFSVSGISQHVYYLTAAGEKFVEEELNGIAEFQSIRERASLAARIDPGAPGSQLKLKQYQVEEYAGTAQGSTIPTRLFDVQTRVKEVRATWV